MANFLDIFHNYIFLSKQAFEIGKRAEKEGENRNVWKAPIQHYTYKKEF